MSEPSLGPVTDHRLVIVEFAKDLDSVIRGMMNREFWFYHTHNLLNQPNKPLKKTSKVPKRGNV